MSVLYLLDTNIVSYVLKGTAPVANNRLIQLPPESVAISAITAAELNFWIARRPVHARLRFHIEDFLRRVPSLPWDGVAAAAYGKLKHELLIRGRPIAELDLQIASHALALDAVLITHDAAFRNIPKLRMEDWVASP